MYETCLKLAAVVLKSSQHREMGVEHISQLSIDFYEYAATYGCPRKACACSLIGQKLSLRKKETGGGATLQKPLQEKLSESAVCLL